MVTKLTSELEKLQNDNSVGVEESEDSMNKVFGVVSNLFTNEVSNAAKADISGEQGEYC